MHLNRITSVSRAATTALLLLAVACGDSADLVQPPTQTLYTTPTGLVTANPPQIFIGAGDMSSCGNNGDEATAQIIDTIPGTVYALGDNVYENGTTSEFNNCYHPTWGRFKARTKPSAGNHDYNTSGASGYYQYYGTAAGDPSKGYYSYDLGLWHIIVLNTNISMGAGSAQDVWLQGVLAAHPNQCKAAYFHHPLWSSTGGSGSGGVIYSGVRALHNTMYAGGVDLILAGHRHFYERLARMKPDGSADPVNGFTSIIVGSGGIGGGSLTNQHPRHVTGNGDSRGVLKLYLYDDSFAWRFIPQAGKTYSDTGSTACIQASPGGGGGVSASLSTVSAAPTSIAPSSGGTTSLITVTARDASGNPVSGASVVLTASGSGNAIAQPGSTTGSNGVATGTLSSTGAGPKTVSATINGVSVNQTATVTVTVGPPSASQSTVSASPASIVVGSGTSTITVTVKDAFGNPIGNAGVTLAATGSGNTLTQPGSTNPSGVTTGTLSSSVPETKTISASVGAMAITQTATVLVSDQPTGNITQSLLTVGFQTVNGSQYATASISPAPNALITLAVLSHRSSGANPPPTITGGGISAWVLVQTVTFDALSVPTRRLSVYRAMSASPGSGPITITHQGSVSNAQWVVSQWTGVESSGTNGSGAIGGIASNATDGANGLSVDPGAFGSPTNVAYGVFGVSSNQAAITAGAGFQLIAQQPSNEGTANDLLAEYAVNLRPITATWNNLRGAALGIEIVAGGSSGGGGAPAALAFITQPGGTVAGSTITPAVQVEIRDALGTRVTGATNSVTLAIGTNPGAGTLAGTLTIAAVNGVATFSNLNINNVGTGYTLTAAATGLAGATSSSFNVTGVPPSPSLSTVTALPASITAGGAGATITVTARDAGTNPISGATVVFAATGSGNVFTPPQATTGLNGVATATLTSTGAGAKTVSATIDGVAITQTAAVTVTAGAPSASTSTVVASPTSIVVGTGSSTITVTVKDANGNPVDAAPVQVGATGTGNTLTPQAGSTNPSGVFTSVLQSTVAEPKTVSATVGGTAIVQTAAVTVTDQPPAGITHTLLTSGTNPTNLAVYTTASISPAPNTLVTIAVLGQRSYGASVAPTVTGGGMAAWTQVTSVTFDVLATPLRRMTIYRAMSAAPGSGPITITFAGNQSNAQWIVSQWDGVETSGTNGSGAIVQTGSNAADVVNGLGATLAAFASPANVAYGVFGVNSNVAAITPGSGFTEVAEVPSGENTPGSLMAERAVNHPTIDALWTNLRGAVLGVEIRAKTGP